MSHFAVSILVAGTFCFSPVAWAVSVQVEVDTVFALTNEQADAFFLQAGSDLILRSTAILHVPTEVAIVMGGDSAKIRAEFGSYITGQSRAIMVGDGILDTFISNAGIISVSEPAGAVADIQSTVIWVDGADHRLENTGELNVNVNQNAVGVAINANNLQHTPSTDLLFSRIENHALIVSTSQSGSSVGVSLQDNFAEYIGNSVAAVRVTAGAREAAATQSAIGISGKGNDILVVNRGEIVGTADMYAVEASGISIVGKRTDVRNFGLIDVTGEQGALRGITQQYVALDAGEAEDITISSHIVNEPSGEIKVRQLLLPQLPGVGARMYGIRSEHAFANIINKGNITVEREVDGDNLAVVGIFTNKRAVIQNDGDITVKTITTRGGVNNLAMGIQALGGNTTVNIGVDGRITADSVVRSVGVLADFNNINIVNRGVITLRASNGKATGLYGAGAQAQYITNHGHINIDVSRSVAGSESDGIMIWRGTAHVLNTGTITMNGSGRAMLHGIHMSGLATAEVINTGNIVLTGVSGAPQQIGMFAHGSVTNAGLIKVSTVGWDLATGVRLSSAGGAILNNTGDIYVSAAPVGNVGKITGIATISSNALITNFASGTISAAGSGVYFEARGTLINNGSIVFDDSVVFPNRHIRNTSVVGGLASFTLENSGSIIGSIERNMAAISMDVGGILEFKKGSFIVGEMLLGGATSISIDGDLPNSIHYVFGGAGDIEGGKPQVSGSSTVTVFYSENGREVTVLDTRYLDTSIDTLEETSSIVSGIIRTRSSLKDDAGLHVWMSGSRSRNDDSEGQDEFVIGANGKIGSASNLSLGILGGYQRNKVWIIAGDDRFNSYEKKMRGLFGAVHGKRSFDNNAFVQVALSGGVMENKDVRFVQDHTVATGIDQAKSVYDSYWFAPEVTLGIEINAPGDLTYTPSVNLRYASQSIDAYVETDAQANASIGEQDTSLMAGRAELAVKKGFSWANITARGGFQYDRPLGDQEIMVSMLDNAVQESVKFRKLGHYGISGGVDVELLLSGTIRSTLSGEVVFHEDDDVSIRGGVALDVVF